MAEGVGFEPTNRFSGRQQPIAEQIFTIQDFLRKQQGS